MRAPQTRGFTLLEMLIVVAIIGILAAFLLSALSAVQDDVKEAAASSQIGSIKAGLAMYESDHGRFPRLASRDTTGSWQDDAPALYIALMNRPTLELGGGQNAPYLADWKPEYVGLLSPGFQTPGSMGDDWTDDDPIGVRRLSGTGRPPETQQLNDPDFQRDHVPGDDGGAAGNGSLVLTDPWGNPYHYREWGSLRQTDKDALEATRTISIGATFEQMSGGAERPLTVGNGNSGQVDDRPHDMQRYDIWSNGANNVNEYGGQQADDVTSWGS